VFVRVCVRVYMTIQIDKISVHRRTQTYI
jgi:hypothetical protein